MLRRHVEMSPTRASGDVANEVIVVMRDVRGKMKVTKPHGEWYLLNYCDPGHIVVKFTTNTDVSKATEHFFQKVESSSPNVGYVKAINFAECGVLVKPPNQCVLMDASVESCTTCLEQIEVMLGGQKG